MIFEELKQQMTTVFVLKHFDSIREVILKMNFLNYVCYDSSLHLFFLVFILISF